MFETEGMRLRMSPEDYESFEVLKGGKINVQLSVEATAVLVKRCVEINRRNEARKSARSSSTLAPGCKRPGCDRGKRKILLTGKGAGYCCFICYSKGHGADRHAAICDLNSEEMVDGRVPTPTDEGAG